MSLKLVRRGGIWHISGTVAGRRIRESTGTGDRALGDQARIKRENEIITRAIHGEKGLVTFGEAAASYLDADSRSPSTAGHVAKLLRHFGPDTRLKDIGQAALDRAYRAILKPTAPGATKLRNVLAPLSAIMEHAARRGWCERPAFERPRIAKATTAFLLPAQATALIRAAVGLERRALYTFLIGTGCRASEAFDLEWKDVDLRGARAVVWQKQGNERHVDLPPVVIAALASLPHREGFVHRPPARLRRGVVVQSERYRDSGRQNGGQAKTAFHTAARRAGVPDLRLHDLRHTWASAHYAMHRDPIRLMKDGGWSQIAMVQRYVHLMPEAYAQDWRAWFSGTSLTRAVAAG
jgi:integrase